MTTFDKSAIHRFSESSVLLITSVYCTTLIALWLCFVCFCADGSFSIFKIILPQHDTRSQGIPTFVLVRTKQVEQQILTF